MIAEKEAETIAIQIVEEKICRHLDQIGKMFKNPKITILVRNPDLKDGDLILTEDSMDEAIKALEKARDRDYERSL